MKIELTRQRNGSWEADVLDTNKTCNGFGVSPEACLGNLVFQMSKDEDWEKNGWPRIEITKVTRKQ